MDVVTLGTGSPLPSPDRAGPATLVRAGGQNLLFDAGRGVLLRLAAVGLGLPALLQQVFLTHLHSDHTTDLGDLVTTNWVTLQAPAPLKVTGPTGTRALADLVVASLVTDVGYRMAHHRDLTSPPGVEVTEVAAGVAYELGDVRVLCREVDHFPAAPAIGYRVEAEDKAVVIAGDTRPCDGLDALCDGADVYVQTVVRTDLVRAVPVARLQDVLDYHSTCEEAGQTASRGGVKTLVLTHLVPGVAPGTEDEWRVLAAEHFDGEVVVASDLTTVTA
ncbi:MAG: MBL fold metallo-hydrolase [Acidimicrobiales bacterium]